jgi:hypothetical protein
MAHGAVTSRLARLLQSELGLHGYAVLYDHGLSGIDPIDRLGKIKAWYGTAYNSKVILADLDIAVVDQESAKVYALVEIEETTDKPKIILGDVLATLLGDSITFQGKRKLQVGEWTTLMVMAHSVQNSHRYRVSYLEGQVNQIKSKLSTTNAVIGNIVVDTFDSETELEHKLRDHLQQALQSHMRK